MAIAADDVDLDRDRGLVRRFQHGDPLAFDELYRRYYQRLVRFCRRRVDDEAEAEELAQEAFAKAWKALPQLGGDQRFYPWLTVIAGRLCIDSSRRRARAHAANASPMLLRDDVEGPEAVVVRIAQRGVVREALGRLTPRHREVLELREQQGWSYGRIAEHYGVSVGTVEAVLLRARRALLREYEALDGRDAGLLVSLPLLGRLLRRLQTASGRLQRWAGVELAPAATPFVAGATVVASVLLGTAGLAATPVQPVRQVAASSAPKPTAIDLGAMARTASVGPAPAGGGSGAGSAGPLSPVAGSPHAAPPVVVGDAEATKRRSAEEPVNGEAGGVIVGADPREAAVETAVTVREYVEQLQAETR